MSYQLLVIDIDGTLIGTSGAISSRDREAVMKASRRGIKVSLSTGRVMKACVGIVQDLGLAENNHIFFDGAWAGNLHGDKVFSHPLSRELVKKMVEFARLHDTYLELYTLTHYFVERFTPATQVRREFFSLEPTLVDFSAIWNEPIIKGELFISSEREEAEVDRFEQHFVDVLRFSRATVPAYPGTFFVNVVEPGVSKGSALAALARHAGVPLSEVAAIGDGPNDISLLSSAGLAVAMGNASAEVKTITEYVTLDVDESGVAEAIDRYILPG